MRGTSISRLPSQGRRHSVEFWGWVGSMPILDAPDSETAGLGMASVLANVPWFGWRTSWNLVGGKDNAMSKPTRGHVGPLKTLVRHLARPKRTVIIHGKQDARDAQLDVLVDSDWAGNVQNGHHRRTTPLESLTSTQEQHRPQLRGGGVPALVRAACFGMGSKYTLRIGESCCNCRFRLDRATCFWNEMRAEKTCVRS